jgi:hypothetical protein
LKPNRRSRSITIKEEKEDKDGYERNEDMYAKKKARKHIEQEDRQKHDDSEIEMEPTNKKAKLSANIQVTFPVGVALAESKAVVRAYLSKATPPALLFKIDNASVKKNSETDFAKEKMVFEQIAFAEEFKKASKAETKEYIKRKLLSIMELAKNGSVTSKSPYHTNAWSQSINPWSRYTFRFNFKY